MDHLPSLRQLQYLTSLAELKSFSRAAAHCHVTQSTFSAGIAALENVLGQNLADRSRRQVALTPLGEEVAHKARAIITAAGDIVERARHMKAPLTGPLRLGIIPTVAPYLLPSLLPALKKAHPGMELQIREDLSPRLVQAAKAGEIDVILLAFPYETPGFEQHELFAEDFVLAAPRGQWKKKGAVTGSDLQGHELLLLEEGHCLRDHAMAGCNLRPAESRRAFGATSLTTLIQMVQHGYGITLLPDMAARHAPKNIDLIPFKRPAPGRHIGLAWRENSPRAAEFELLAGSMGKALI
jgi:LysR family transcriptional regulator, hydrogen peroxide-inducible genes activator